MKKVISVMLLIVFLFNMGGYRLLANYLINEADEFANEQISKGKYRPAELVEIKIPVNLPYSPQGGEYTDVAGQVQLKGQDYNYVAMKFSRDTMYLKCIPNYEKTRLVNQNIISAKEISDNPLQKRNHTGAEKKSGVDNEYNIANMVFSPVIKAQGLQTIFTYTTPDLANTCLSTPAQPPELS